MHTRTPTLVLWTLLLSSLVFFSCGDEDPTSNPPDTTWKEAFGAQSFGWLLNVSGSSSDNLYAVGGEPDEGLIFHYNGAAWFLLDTGLQFPLLNWVRSFGPDNTYVVGNEGTLLHFDGTSWTRMNVPTDQNLWGIWGPSPDNLWVVGGNGRSEGQATILHYNGTEWAAPVLPKLPNGANAIYKVWGSASQDVYFVGQAGTALHFSNNQFTLLDLGAQEDLVSVWGTGPHNVVIVGGRSNAIISTYNGTAWQTETLLSVPGLNGVWLQNNQVAHIAGAQGALGTVKLATLEPTLEETETFLDYHAIFGVDGVLTTVGGNFRSVNGPYEGIAEQRELSNQD